MIRICHLFLILALTFGPAFAPSVSSAAVSEMPVVQMDPADLAETPCDGCVSSDQTAATPCKECIVPCGTNSMTAPPAGAALVPLLLLFATISTVDEPPFPLGSNPVLDPFPPKLSV